MEKETNNELVLDDFHCANCSNSANKIGASAVNIEKVLIVRLSASIVFLILALTFRFHDLIKFLLFLISYLIVGWDVLHTAFKNILKGKIFDENFLMGVATIGAFIIKEYPEAVAVMLFYQVGEMLQDLAVGRSKKSIENLLKIKPDFANIILNGELVKVKPQEVRKGEKIVIKPGEKIPLDGKIVQGSSVVDTSVLTGESIPILVEKGDDVLSGFINMNGILTVKVTSEFDQSTISKILEMVQNASSKKATTEKFITRFAAYYTPIVVFTALSIAIIPQFIMGGFNPVWLYRALLFLVISCPCALVISVPLGFFGGIGAASRNGVLIKGGNFLEALNNLEIVAFDKTGTLTKGNFEVSNLNPKNGFSEDELLEYAAYAEYYSNHPIALSILNYYGEITEKNVEKNLITDYVEYPGYGVKSVFKGNSLLAGNMKFLVQEGVFENLSEATVLLETDNNHPRNGNDASIVYVAVDNKYVGSISVSDTIKHDSANTISGLKKLGIKEIAMLTGDNKNIGAHVGKIIGIDRVYADLLPQQKVEVLEFLEKQKSPKGKIAFVGDGINDSPVLARADIGIAMGALGSDAAMEAADIVLMTDEPSKLIKAIGIGRKTRNIVLQNIIFAVSVKIIILLLGAAGIATMWEAVFADVGVALLAVLNSMRILRGVPTPNG